MHDKRSSSNNLQHRENADRDHQAETKKDCGNGNSPHRHEAIWVHNLGVTLQSKTKRSTRQYLYVRTVELGVAKEIAMGIENRGHRIEIGALEANTGDEADFVEINGVHDVAGADLLNKVKLAGGIARLGIVVGISAFVSTKGVIDIEEIRVGA